MLPYYCCALSLVDNGIRAMNGRCMSLIYLQLRSFKKLRLLYIPYGLKSNKFHNY